jgi:ADP-ribose pyrophosphatase YjhB (NUDIX family)
MDYRFCPWCGNALVVKMPSPGRRKRLCCLSCSFVHYRNPKPCVGALIVDQGKVLLTQRGLEPFKGRWDFPGGFLETGEHPQDGLRREVTEELRVSIDIIRQVGIYMDFYGPEGESTLNIYYECRIVKGDITPQAEIGAVKWVAQDELSTVELAFKHAKAVLQDWQKQYAVS